jgi:hypothetical protein
LYRWIDRLEKIETHPTAKAHPRGQED